jgi:polyhydroxyalkanoate synthase subunit PhaC
VDELTAPWTAFLSGDQRQMMERLSMNLAKAAMTTQGAFAEAALRSAEDPTALRADPLNLSPAFGEVLGSLAAQPDRLVRAQADLLAGYMNLWQATARRAAGAEPGEPAVKPPAGDRRFSDPEWQDNPLFDVMKQSYLLTSNWLNGLVAEAQGVDPTTKRRVEFFMKMLTDAFAPSNFLMSNPAALREAVQSNGESLLRGMENFVADLERGGGQLKISQSDLSKFKVGENVATAPGKVVFRNELIELLQFDPSTDKVHEIPLLIFPPWINKFYILDLRAENSMIRWLSSQGFTVFVVSWINPGPELAQKTFEDYMFEGVYTGIEAVTRQTGAKKVNTVGYCIAGTLMSCTLAHMAANGDDRVASTTFFAAQQDFSESGDLRLFTDEDWLRIIETKMTNAGGVLPSDAMADTFNALRANDLIWSSFVNNYLLGKDSKPFDLLFWNSDQTRMPSALHLFYLRRFYQENALAEGRLELGGVQLDLGKVKTPIFVQAGKEDHIAPATSVYKGARLFGGPVKFVLAGSGHIAGVINHPAAKKYQHWIAEGLPESLDGWMSNAVEHPGSWWPAWKEWLSERSGPMVPARDPTKGPLPPLADAPGTYVKIKG